MPTTSPFLSSPCTAPRPPSPPPKKPFLERNLGPRKKIQDGAWKLPTFSERDEVYSDFNVCIELHRHGLNGLAFGIYPSSFGSFTCTEMCVFSSGKQAHKSLSFQLVCWLRRCKAKYIKGRLSWVCRNFVETIIPVINVRLFMDTFPD